LGRPRARGRPRHYGIVSRRASAAPRPSTGWDALTATERTVAGLVAEGHSNPDIATRLFTSRRTVQSHVSSILTKLECASLGELAVAVLRRTGQAST
jgi:DNA-binding NarL/FixJ family response regulator